MSRNNPPPISFKTVPGRNRTQKWNVAKQYDYSGDDWGGYDAYDAYGTNPYDQHAPQNQQQQSAPATLPPQPNFPTQLPSQQQRGGRQNSFDQGTEDERRQFSAGPVLYGGSGGSAEGSRSGGISPARSAVSGTSSGGRRSGDYPGPGSSSGGRPRDFTNPEQVPLPLSMAGSRASPAPSSSSAAGPTSAPPGGATFPPRGSSISDSSAPTTTVSSAKPAEKDLPTPPFVRPSDIYKRMLAEQEKEKERKASEGGGQLLPPSGEMESSRGLAPRPLSAVDEDPSQQGSATNVPEGFGEPNTAPSAGGTGLPDVQGVSSFGSDWFGGRRTEPSQAPVSSDPAAEILAERTHETPIEHIGRQPDELAHQPSQGYRSVVNRAFDHSATSDTNTSFSRDNSQSTSGLSRSNTESTSSISPIMSHVPSASTAQQDRFTTVPPIAEEPSIRPSLEERQSTPTERNTGIAAAGVVAAGAAAVGVAAGYRRNFDPPSSGTSPAHTPDLKEAPSVPDQGVEMQPMLEEAETPASEIDQSGYLPESSSLPSTGRARAGTDFSIRESDIADAVNHPASSNSPDMSAAEAAGAERAEQNLFLRTHAGTPTTPTAALTASASGSPVKSRVRELADKYAMIQESSRRDSQGSLGSTKSSWSRFGNGSEENVGKIKRQGTEGSGFSVSDYGTEASPTVAGGGGGLGDEVPERPEMGREASFRPRLPGGWDSFRDNTPTPAEEYSPAALGEDDEEDLAGQDRGLDHATPRASYEPSPTQREEEENMDFTPTTKKSPLSGSQSQPSSSPFDQLKNTGTALGTALLSTMGMSHQTRDFGSAEPAQPVDNPEMHFRSPTGEVGGLRAPQRPFLERGDTEATNVTDISSVASSVPPTPPAKDSPQPTSMARAERGDYYFSGAPLRTGRSQDFDTEAATSGGEAGERGSGMSHALSMHPKAGDMESDRLRKEIVRSLDSAGQERMEEDAERNQDALNAPLNAERVAEGRDALPNVESEGRPMLDQRFSWETRDYDEEEDSRRLGGGFRDSRSAPEVAEGREKELPRPTPVVHEPVSEHSPEIKPEMPYERPRSRGLHIMNADSDDEEHLGDERRLLPSQLLYQQQQQQQAAPSAPEEPLSRGLSVATSSAGPVSPITKSQENLHISSVTEATRDGGDGLSSPSPVGSEGKGSVRLPSYYMLEVPGLEGVQSLSDDMDHAPEVVPPGEGPIPLEGEGRELNEDQAPQPLAKDVTPTSPLQEAALPSPTSPTSRGEIQPFRKILAIKAPAERIRTYDDTRRSFADMNTGLSDWLSGMLAQHPEHASLSTPHGGFRTTAEGGAMRGHKSSPSLANKFTRQFSGAQNASPQQQSPGGGGEARPITPSKESPGGGPDMDKLKQGGKDLMKNASVLGGKAQAGAKGLWGKGKSRFGSTRTRDGGSKDLSSASQSQSTSESTTRTSLLPQVPVLDRSDPDVVLQPTPTRASVSRSASGIPSMVPTRSQTQTPSSVASSGGLLSRTLSRLRDRSTSKSRSLSRRSSRPASVVLGHADLGSIQDASPVADRTAVGVVERSADQAVISPWTQSGTIERSADQAVISPWAEPEALISSREADTGDGVPDRIGILPSPTATSFVVEKPTSPSTANTTVGASRPNTREAQIFGDLNRLFGGRKPEKADDRDLSSWTPQPQESSSEQSNFRTTTSFGGSSQPDPSSMAQTAADEEEEDLYTSSPVLPKMKPILSEEDGEMYESDDEAVQKVWTRGSREVATNAEDKDDDRVFAKPELNVRSDEQHVDEKAVDEAQTSYEKRPDSPITALEKAPDNAGINGTNERQLSPDIIHENGQVSEQASVASEKVDEAQAAPDVASRRSSVSSLGSRPAVADQHPEDVQQDVQEDAQEGAHEGPIVPPQLATAAPIIHAPPPLKIETRSDSLAAQERNFEDRSYLSRPDEPRPLSFERSSVDAVAEEALTSGKTPPKASPPDKHVPNYSPEFNTTTLTRHRKQSLTSPTADRRSKRLSGFFRDQEAQSNLITPEPSLRASSGQYSLEGSQHVPSEIAEEPDRAESLQTETTQSKRSSGIWQAFKPSPRVSKEDDHRERDLQAKENIKPPPSTYIGNSYNRDIEAPQRSSTVVTQPEKKKKRFSGLGSIFGRSSTTGHKPEKPRKLTKAVPAVTETQQRPAVPPAGNMQRPNVLPGSSMPNHALQRPTVLPGSSVEDQPMPRPAVPPGRSAGNQSMQRPAVSSVRYDSEEAAWIRMRPDPRSPDGHGEKATGPPPGGWYAPRNDPGFRQQEAPPVSPQPYSQQTYQSAQRQMRYSDVSEPSRPVDPPYLRPVASDDPTDDYRLPRISTQAAHPIAGHRTSYPQRPAPNDQQSASSPPERRKSAHTQTTEDGLTPQISGRSEWQGTGWRPHGSSPAISPIRSTKESDGHPASRDTRVGSISEEMARSPAREYPDQQTPWVISMPRSENEARTQAQAQPQPQPQAQSQGPRSSYWARQRRRKPEQADDRMRTNYSGYAPPPGAYGNASSIPTYLPQIVSSQVGRQSEYPQDPKQERSYRETSVDQRVPPVPHAVTVNPYDRYSRDQVDASQGSKYDHVIHEDDHEPGEEDVEMRGVSYPGQEWMPASWEE